MAKELLHGPHHQLSVPALHSPPFPISTLHVHTMKMVGLKNASSLQTVRRRCTRRRVSAVAPIPCTQPISASLAPLDLTEDNVKRVLADARVEFPQIFDTSVGMTGKAELAELDGPFVKISLRGRFWHERSTVLARLGNYLKQRIPEILEVDIEDEKQLDDSPENF